MIYEYGCWKLITGAVESGESIITAGIREVREEVGVAIDSGFTPLLCFGSTAAGWFDGTINNFFYCIVLKAKTREFVLDGHEVNQAEWWATDHIQNVTPLPSIHSMVVDITINATTRTVWAGGFLANYTWCADQAVPLHGLSRGRVMWGLPPDCYF